jgi:hypothetical protein
MRIIGYLDRPGMVVTVFKNDNKLSVKFEKNLLEQIYKIRDDMYLIDLNEIDSLFDDTFIADIEKIFDLMLNARENSLHRFQDNLTSEQEIEII